MYVLAIMEFAIPSGCFKKSLWGTCFPVLVERVIIAPPEPNCHELAEYGLSMQRGPNPYGD